MDAEMRREMARFQQADLARLAERAERELRLADGYASRRVGLIAVLRAPFRRRGAPDIGAQPEVVEAPAQPEAS